MNYYYFFIHFIHFEFLNFSWMVGKVETVLQEVVEEETKIHLDDYLRDTFLHFGETWENIQVCNKIEMGALVHGVKERLYKLTVCSIPEDSSALMHQPAILLDFRFNR